ncbi:sulfurtransferase [Pseudonocardia xinjiangensis]|uniref:sulfurtransferase n=1 Tax=Pseudonocardia xinjiangensis TaxID=75289 RepID=UPI003D8BA4F6
MTESEVPVFVGVAELEKWLQDTPERVRLLEIRYDQKTGGTGGAGHLPGAVTVDLATELARSDADPVEGRRPLPDPADLQRSARRWGLRGDSTVVVYDTRSGLSAARAWWVLRWAGLQRVSILDGGLQAWTAAGHELETEEPGIEPGDVELGSGGLPELDADAAAALAARGLLVDARDAQAYREGHIPGARNVPSQGVLGAAGTLADADEVRAHYGLAAADAPVPGLSCGGGVAGAFAVAALAHAGVTAPLYVGSFSAWSADPDRPVATGAEPGTGEEAP